MSVRRNCDDCGESYVVYISGSSDYGYRHDDCPARRRSAEAQPGEADGGPFRQVTPCCFREAGAHHPSICPQKPERWAYEPIRADECVPMKLVPVDG